jgi:hypothetical protein
MIKALWQDPDESEIAGLFRYEGDGWRQGEQGHEKIWTVSTGWGANAAAQLAALLADNDDDRAVDAASKARELLELVLPGGALCEETSYLPEQFFDSGEPDSATPLGLAPRAPAGDGVADGRTRDAVRGPQGRRRRLSSDTTTLARCFLQPPREHHTWAASN